MSVLDHVGSEEWVQVFSNSEFQIAFQYRRGLGEFISIASNLSLVEQISISSSACGWKLVSEIWEDMYFELNEYNKSMAYPKCPVENKQYEIIDRALCKLVDKISSGELTI